GGGEEVVSTRRIVARNVLWNWAGIGTGMVVGLVVAPYLVRHLGHTGYGLWILLASLAGYFGLVDVGVRGAVGRNVAYYQAKGDGEQINRLLSTALAVLCAVGGVAFLGSLVLQWGFLRLFDVPPEQVASVRMALLVVCLTFALSVPGGAFDATLW